MTAALLEAPDTVDQTVALLREAAQAMRSVTTPPTDEARAIQAAVNALQARQADLLAIIDDTKAHESESCASVATWAARELRQDPGTTRQMVRAANTMRDLPSIGAAAHTGMVSLDHVHACTFGLKHVGHDEVTAIEAEVHAVALEHAPRELFTLMRYAKAIVHSDELDEAWLRGMDKEDFRVLRVGDGYQPSGFLGIDLGAKLKVFLDAASVPTDGDDTRSNAQRRIDALEELLSNVLSSGLPADCGIKPHLSVIVDAESLRYALTGTAFTATQGELIEREPAILEGFGPIGPALLAYLAWGADLTPILVTGFKENRKVLDAGRTQRLATKRQRQIIWWRQKGRCANRGCHHPIGEIHHVTDWHHGGKTNLDNTTSRKYTPSQRDPGIPEVGHTRCNWKGGHDGPPCLSFVRRRGSPSRQPFSGSGSESKFRPGLRRLLREGPLQQQQCRVHPDADCGENSLGVGKDLSNRKVDLHERLG